MSRQAIGFVTDKAPSGGYQLSKIVSLEGEIQFEVVAYRTTLAEVQAIEHTLKSHLFGEEAWIPTPYPPRLPANPVQPQSPTPEYEPDVPKVVAEQQVEHAQGLLDRFRNGHARGLVAPLFLAGVWMSVNLPRCVL